MPKGFSTFQKYLILGGVLLCTGSLVLFTNAFAGTKIGTTLNLASTAGGLDYGLVGHWTFDGKDMPSGQVNDTSGQGNHGSQKSMSTSTAYVQGAIGQALAFDGANSHVDFGNASTLQLDTGTASAWIKTTDAGSSYRGIISKSSAYGMFLLSNVFGVYDNNAAQFRSTSVNLADGKWHHVAFSFQSGVANGTLVYIDGTLSLTTTTTHVNQSSTAKVGRGQNSTQIFWGSIDDPRIYSRILSPDEIKQLYQLGATTKVATTPAPSPAPGGLDNGLVGHWTFDGKDTITGQIDDTSGQGNNGSFRGMATTTSYVGGRLGQGSRFNLTDDYVEVAHNASLEPSTITFSAWVKPTVADLSGTPRIIYKRSGNTGYIMSPSSGSPRVLLGTGTGLTTLTGSPMTAGEWYHIVGTYDGDRLRQYMNGALSNTSGSVAAAFSGTNLTIGADDAAGSEWQGSIDDVRIYNRALSADEVKQLYQLGATTKAATTPNTSSRVGGLDYGLVGHYTFDGKDTITGQIDDTSGTANHGSQVSMSSSTAYVQGALGQALKLDGIDDYVVIDAAANDFGFGSNFSMSAWVKVPPVCTSTKICTIVGRNTSAGGNCFIFTIGDNVGGTALDNELAIHDGVSSAFEGDTNTVVADNTWHQVGYTLSGTTGTLYVDGIAKSTHTADYVLASSDLLSIGQEWDTATPSDFFPGTVDDVRFYNRALSDDEMKSLYQMGQ